MSESENQLLRRITTEPGKCGGKPCIRGMRIRVGAVKSAAERAIVVALPGLSEFGEKYFEVAHDVA